jgi:Rad3-related DNA helicase
VPLSVSDYTKVGQINNVCPYYLMRDRLPFADLLILPYNYVLDEELRQQINLSLEESVIVFDEGHNIEAHCEELF